MMDALGIAPDLLADDAQRVGIVLGAPNPADRVFVEHLDLERAGRRAIMGADRIADLDIGENVHGRAL